MFPIRDNIPSQQFPYVNIGLIVVNTLFFLYEFTLGPGLDQFITTYGFIPARFLEQQNNTFDVSGFFPVMSSMFLHGNLLHLISNMWMLWIFGDNVEDCMGHGRYIVFYLLCGIASVVAQTISAPSSPIPMVGASGAISGVLGAYFLTYPRARILTLVPIFIFFYMIDIPAFFFLGFWFFIQFIQGYVHLVTISTVAEGGVAWWAHIGGFGAGALLIHLFRDKHWKP